MPKSPKSINADSVQALAELLNNNDLTEIEYELGDERIRVVRQPATVTVASAAPVAAAPAAAVPAPEATTVGSAAPADAAPAAINRDTAGAVTSPMVGTVYLAPEPEAPNFVAEGDSVTAGQTLMLIEAMKTFNEIKAPHGGIVRWIGIENGSPVEFGDVLMIVE
jgi:acetyl-CoA carboxylase biotin carboxyl carrier protein